MAVGLVRGPGDQKPQLSQGLAPCPTIAWSCAAEAGPMAAEPASRKALLADLATRPARSGSIAA
jgi:hypothetical protein